MRSVTVRLDDLRTMILNLGFVGENEHRKFNFDCKKMFGEYPSASVSLTVQPPAGDCYPATVERNGDMVSWTVTDSDLIEEGCGEIQLTFMVGEVKAKTCIGRTKVERSLGATGDIPTPIENWIEQAEEVISEAEAATAAAEDAAEHQPIIDDNGYWAVWDADAEEYVATEYKAQGTDGHDGVGIVSIEKTGTSGLVDTYTITFTSGNPVTYTVTNGRDADPAELIDDTSTAQNRTWSAKKLDEEKQSLLTEINSTQDDVSALQKNKAPVIIDSAEGNPIVLTDGADGLPIEGIKIHFSPIQSGTGDPSPSNIRPISGWTGLTAWRTGKNLLPNKTYARSLTTLVVGSDKDERNIHLKAGTYTFSVYCSKAVALIYSKTDGQQINIKSSGGSTGLRSASFTLTEDAVCEFFVYISAGVSASDISWMQLEIVNVDAPSYAEYTGESYPVTFGQTIYGGTPDVVNGVLKVEWAKFVATSSAIRRNDGNRWYIPNTYTNSIIPQADTADAVISNVFKSATGGQYDDKCFINSSGAIRFNTSTEYESIDALVSAIPGMEFVFLLATPYEIPLSDIPVPVTLIGDNTIWSDANGTIELDYRADTKLFIAKSKQDIRATIAPIEDGTTASKAYSAGELFYHDGNLCKAKTSIASGATFTLNTNYEVTTVADELFALN